MARERRERQRAETNEQKHGDKDYQEPASESYSKYKAKELEKAKGRGARRDAHDKKQGRGDRTREELDEDYDE